MGNNKISFWIPGNNPESTQHIFGCSSHGYSTQDRYIFPDKEGIAYWEHELPGEVLCGSYQEVLKSLFKLAAPEICIVVSKKATGFENFLYKSSKALPGTSFIGGIAACTGELTEGEILPVAEDVCLITVSGKNYQFEILNIYEKTQIQVEFKATSKRHISRIKELPEGEWQNAVSYYRSKQIEFGVEPNNFESLCFCDKNKRNLHCSISNGTLFVGAKLPKEKLLTLNFISHDKATEKLEKFIDDTDSLIFGCAGIQSLIDEPIFTGERSLSGFMFGEIVTCGEKVELGNLMLTKLKLI